MNTLATTFVRTFHNVRPYHYVHVHPYYSSYYGTDTVTVGGFLAALFVIFALSALCGIYRSYRYSPSVDYVYVDDGCDDVIFQDFYYYW